MALLANVFQSCLSLESGIKNLGRGSPAQGTFLILGEVLNLLKLKIWAGVPLKKTAFDFITDTLW